MINVKQILADNGLAGEDVENVLDTVEALLHAVADKLRQDEPEATTTINSMESAARQVYELSWYIC